MRIISKEKQIVLPMNPKTHIPDIAKTTIELFTLCICLDPFIQLQI